MRLNKTYRLTDLLDAVSAASDKLSDVVSQMREAGELSRDFTTFDPEGMLTTSPYARVTLTTKVSDHRWEGYMETSMCTDGPRVLVAVVRNDMVAVSDDENYRNIQIVTRKTGRRC